MSHVECMIMTMQLSKEPNNCIQKDTTVNCVFFFQLTKIYCLGIYFISIQLWVNFEWMSCFNSFFNGKGFGRGEKFSLDLIFRLFFLVFFLLKIYLLARCSISAFGHKSKLVWVTCALNCKWQLQSWAWGVLQFPWLHETFREFKKPLDSEPNWSHFIQKSIKIQ